MQTAETLIVLGVLVLFSIFTMSVHQFILGDKELIYESEEMIEAIALAQGFIEEAEMMRFDEDSTAMTPTLFTDNGELGPETGESYPNFDDVDDFNGYQATEQSLTVPYTISIDVHYVNESSPYSETSSETYIKESVVSISSDQFTGSSNNPILQFKKLFAYHYFFMD